jgi:hypothetical protein
MKRTCLFVVAALAVSGSAFAAGKPCEELKSEIAQKLEAKGVTGYSLDIVDKDKEATGKVVGTCEGGAKKIVYDRTGAKTVTAEPAAAKASTGKPADKPAEKPSAAKQ